MIVSRAIDVGAMLAEIDTLQRAAREADEIGETLTELKSVHGKMHSVRQTHNRIRDRLSADSNQRLERRFVQLLENVRASRDDFEQRSRQAVKLRQVANGAAELTRQIDAEWQAFATNCVFPYAELLALVETLPDMRPRIGLLRSLRRRLDDLAERAPTNDLELAEFDQKLQRLRDELDRIEGLTPSVVTFLRRVIQETATLADLNDEVLIWCRSGGRAASFSLTFRSES